MKTARRLVFGVSLFVAAASAVLWLSEASLPIPPLALVLIAGGAFALAVLAFALEANSWRTPTPEDPPVPSQPITPKSPAEKALDAMDSAREISSRTERKVRIQIDSEDDPND
ncbi:hypothetical protein VZO05_09695 [Aggregatilineales bacterium SYSU G02658]